MKITKTVRLKDLEGTWTDVDVAAARGEGEGAAAGRLREACRTEKDLTPSAGGAIARARRALAGGAASW